MVLDRCEGKTEGQQRKKALGFWQQVSDVPVLFHSMSHSDISHHRREGGSRSGQEQVLGPGHQPQSGGNYLISE